MWDKIADWLYSKASITKARQRGFEFAIVVDTEDPWKLGRIRVRYPWHGQDDMSDWIWPATGRSSDKFGSTFHIPHLDDLVLVVFYDGDITRGAYLGSIWTPGGIGPRGAVKPRETIIKGYEPQPPDPDSYDHNVPPNKDPISYDEPPDMAWITNNPKSRVHEFKTAGGLRLMWEEFKRRLRTWTHPSTPFTLEVDHFDGESFEPPRATPYHNMKVASPNGTVIQVEEDEASGTYITKVVHHSGLKLVMEYSGGGAVHKITMTNPSGESVVIDEALWKVYMQDRNGGQVLLDAQSGTRKVSDPAGNQVILDENAGSVSVQAPADITLNAGGSISITAGGNVTIDGTTINIG